MDEESLQTIVNLLELLHEQVAALEQLIQSRHSFTSLELQTPISNLEFDLYKAKQHYTDLLKAF